MKPVEPAKPVEAPKVVEAPKPRPKLAPVVKGPPPTDLVRAAEDAVRKGQFENAIQQAKQALKRDEKFVPAMVVMAKAYYSLKKYELATAIIDIAAGIDKQNAEAFHLRGFIALAQKDEPRALASFQKATEYKPDYASAWSNLGAQYLKAKNYPEAQKALEKAVQLDPNLSRAHLNLGSAYRGLKEHQKSEASYRSALRLVPSYAQAHFNLGILYLDAADFPGMEPIPRLGSAISNLTKYKELMSFRLAKDDPADAYIEEARKAVEREQKRIEREKKKREQPKAPAAGAKPAAPPAK